ncbi:MAG: lysophospholipid acyltransferase family protein [Bradyrhizobium sp.]|nr:lysophospholipid acyltransferase family protein [Pseudomonadota bacterium]MDE2470516.1 lysophospholipid acyltransferase family protein [Bradyrhizobium sp.]
MHDLVVRSLKLACRLPRPLRDALSAIAGTVAWAVAAQPRRNVTSNVKQVLRHFSGEPRALHVQHIARRVFRRCISNYLELFALPRLAKEEILGRIDVVGQEHFEQAIAQGGGVIIASAHLGPFEYLPSWMPARGFEMTIPVERMEDRQMLGMMLQARLSNGVTFVPLTGFAAIRTMVRTLRKRQVVLITADRAVEGQSTVVSFFGAPARLPIGPVDLAIMTGAPLIGGFGWCRGRRDIIEFAPISLALPVQQRADRAALQAALVDQLERAIGTHVDEWVVFEPIWQY